MKWFLLWLLLVALALAFNHGAHMNDGDDE